MAAADEEEGPDDPAFAFRPSLLGAPHEMRLTPASLEVRVGPQVQRVPYGSIRRVRLSFRPATLQPYRFQAEIWPADGPKITVPSTSWRSMVEQQRLDRPYSDFIAALHRRITAAEGGTLFERGVPAFVYWPGFALLVLAAALMAGLAVRALQAGATLPALVIAAILAAFVWQSGTYFKRNRPGRYRADEMPADLLPRADERRSRSA